jgi:hypothetical protein
MCLFGTSDRTAIFLPAYGTIVACISLTVVTSLAVTSTAFAYTGENLASPANATMTDASTIALKARPGNITDREFEHAKRAARCR